MTPVISPVGQFQVSDSSEILKDDPDKFYTLLDDMVFCKLNTGLRDTIDGYWEGNVIKWEDAYLKYLELCASSPI
jgi:hypothetical protein